MAETIFENRKYKITEFYGGINQGICVQITPLEHSNYFTLTQQEVEELANQLLKWIEQIKNKQD